MVIRQAFFDIIKSEPVEQATVTKICKLAEINRATFYRYYENQYDLLSVLENEMFDEIKNATYKYVNDVDKLTEIMFGKFYEQKNTWSLLLSDHADLGFLSKIYSFFNGLFNIKPSSKEAELRYRFMLYGFSSIFDYWIKNGMKESPQEMSVYVNRLRNKVTAITR